MSYAPTPRPKPTAKRHEKRTIAPLPQNIKLTDDKGGVDRNSVTIAGPGAGGGPGSVTWFSNRHSQATIVFDKGQGSPFACDTFYVPAGGSVSSGPAVSGSAGTSFGYTVHGQAGHNDPVIVVDP
ncbi:MAG TPA: hypothetical protein VJA94_12615 [Candidatus Angelobacter sp.]